METEELIEKLGIKPDFYVNGRVAIGKNLLSSLAKIADKSFFMLDKISSKPFFEYLGAEFDSEKCAYFDHGSTGDDLKKAVEKIERDKGINAVVGIGAGRILDFAKFIAMKTNRAVITIPTALTTHVYASPKIHASNPVKSLGFEKTIDWRMPDLCIIEVPFLEKMQRKDSKLIKTGLGDIMAFMIAMEDWKLSYERGKTDKPDSSVINTIDKIIKNMHKINVDSPLSGWIKDYVDMQASLCEITGKIGSAPASGSEHLFAKAAEQASESETNHPLHGELVALGSLIMAFLHGKDYRKIKKLMGKLHLPNSLKEIGITKEQTVEALYNAKKEGQKKGRYTILDEIEMSEYFCRNIIGNLLKEKILAE